MKEWKKQCTCLFMFTIHFLVQVHYLKYFTPADLGAIESGCTVLTGMP